MPINLSDEYKTNESLYNRQEGEGVSLPFPYLQLYWHNGNRRDPKENGAMYYGGWQRGEEGLQTELNAMNLTALPKGFTDAVQWTADDGKLYIARSSRSVYIAPILVKIDWGMVKDRYTQQEKLIHTCDLLGYLASLEGKALVPWGLAVISAKNYVASSLETALTNFAKETVEARNKFANSLDSRYFYHALGTFGPERIDVASKGARPYVPVQLNPPKSGWTEDALTWAFVGETVAAIMASARKEADEWGKDTRDARQKNRKSANSDPVQFAQMGPENFSDDPPF